MRCRSKEPVPHPPLTEVHGRADVVAPTSEQGGINFFRAGGFFISPQTQLTFSGYATAELLEGKESALVHMGLGSPAGSDYLWLLQPGNVSKTLSVVFRNDTRETL